MRFLTLLFILSVFLSCSKTKWEVKEFNGYSVELPDYLTEAKDLNDAAEVQYENNIKEIYFILIRESKDEAVGYTYDSYCDFVKDNFHDGAGNHVENTVLEKINGLLCCQFEVFGQINDIEIYYNVAVYEGKNDFYQLVGWTIKGRMVEYKTDLERIVKSLKEK